MLETKEIGREQWEKIYEFIRTCGSACDSDRFAVQILDHIGEFCEYDCGSAYLLDRNGKISGLHLRNIEERLIKVYMAYYANTDGQRYSMFGKKTIGQRADVPAFNVHDWEGEPSAEFIPDFIRQRGLKYSWGAGFYDTLGELRLIIALDRKTKKKFTEKELQLLELILPLLNNLHRNFYYQNSDSKVTMRIDEEKVLTPRETQIAELLCQSVSPSQISEILHIARSTTYKHIAHIYEKMNVSSQRELLSRLLNS